MKFPKYKKGDYRVEPRKEQANFGYVAELINHLFSDVVYNAPAHSVALDAIDIPPDLCSNFINPKKKLRQLKGMWEGLIRHNRN